MRLERHKRKTNHILIVTSDAVDANVKQFKIRPWILETVILILCVVIGVLIGFFVYEEKLWETARQRSAAQEQAAEELEAENRKLLSEINGLNEQIQILSDTVNQKVQSESELTAALEGQSLPTEFPLTGAASMQEVTEGDPMCIFTASVGTMVVSAAAGTVTAVNDDPEYGHSVWVDHGNGYVTVYRNQGEATVKQGDTVVQGTTLFLVGEENTALGYQMMKDGAYINPMEMLEING